VDRVVKKFTSFEEAEEADRQYYLSLTPEERLDILAKSSTRPTVKLSPDLKEFIALLNAHRVEIA
jgi:hypothetical protein